MPMIFDIQRFSLDNGPGIRTTVFFKGCPLSCGWCHNPESKRSGPEIAFYPHLCLGCGDCKKNCPQDAISLKDTGRIIRKKCTVCGRCTKECPTGALKMIGQYYSVDYLIELLLRDRNFYEISKGGVTFSGGEPTLFMDYLSQVVRVLKGEDIHLALQTCGMFDWLEFQEKIWPYVDLIFYDLKIFDPQKHRQYTGVGNEKILENFIYLSKQKDKGKDKILSSTSKIIPKTIIPRTPLIPNITDTSENLSQIADFVKRLGYSTHELLPYNPVGVAGCKTGFFKR